MSFEAGFVFLYSRILKDFSPNPERLSMSDVCFSSTSERFRDVFWRVKSLGLTCAIENWHGYTDYQIPVLDELLESPVFGLTFDVGHNLVKKGQDEPVIMARRNKLYHMHLHDVKDGTKDHQALGTGELDIFKCLNLAKEQDISVVVETKTIAGLKQSAAWLHDNWK